jgi:Cu+-exporting ATPase
MNPENIESKPTSSANEARKEKGAEKARLVVSVNDISCTVCALAIEKQVKKIKGVDEVKTSIMLNKVFIDYDPKLVDIAIVRKAIDKTGYKSNMAIEENH